MVNNVGGLNKVQTEHKHIAHLLIDSGLDDIQYTRSSINQALGYELGFIGDAPFNIEYRGSMEVISISPLSIRNKS